MTTRTIEIIRTAWDARCEKRDAELPALEAAEKALRETRWIADVLARNPQIGVLAPVNGQTRYYAYLNGYAAEPTISEGSAGLARLAFLLVQF